MMLGMLTLIQLCFGILENIASDAGFVGTVGNSVLKIVEHVSQILVSPHSILLSFRIRRAKESHHWNIVLPVVARRSKIGNLSLHMRNLLKQLAIDAAVNAESVVEG